MSPLSYKPEQWKYTDKYDQRAFYLAKYPWKCMDYNRMPAQSLWRFCHWCGTARRNGSKRVMELRNGILHQEEIGYALD